MWEQFFLVGFAIHLSFGNLLSATPNYTELVTAISLVEHDLKICMGDHIKLFYSSVKHDGWLGWNFSVEPEPIKTMLDVGLSVERFYRMYLQADTIVTLARKIDWSEETLKAYGIWLPTQYLNMYLNKIWSSGNTRGVTVFHPSFDNYFSKRQKLDSLIQVWTDWTSAHKDDREFERSCTANGMNEWFLEVKAMAAIRYNVSNIHNRGLYTLAARQIKSDMCGATLLLGACDNVLNSSDRLRSRHVANFMRVYRQFAAGSREMDKELVENARANIARYLHLSGGDWVFSDMNYVNKHVQNQFYWLDISATVAVNIGYFSGYPPEPQCPCLITVGSGTRRAYIHVSSRTPKLDNSTQSWRALEQVVEDCGAKEKPCDAHEIYDGTSHINGSAAFIATVHTALAFNTARIEGFTETVQMFEFYANVNAPPTKWEGSRRKILGIWVHPCDRDIYIY